jgi:hypothetical protein
MLRWVDPVMAAGQHRHGAAVDAGAVRRLIDAARQTGGNDKTGLAEIMRQFTCEFPVLWRKRHKPNGANTLACIAVFD